MARFDFDVKLVAGGHCSITDRARQSIFGRAIPGVGVIDGRTIIPVFNLAIESIYYDENGEEESRSGPSVEVGFDTRDNLTEEELSNLSPDGVLFAMPIALTETEKITLDYKLGKYFFVEFSIDDLIGETKKTNRAINIEP
jgi:hypothetical protein